jgi:hypothetical protein
MNAPDVTPWIGDWAWSLPLIVLTLVIHVCGLALIGEGVVNVLDAAVHRHNFIPKFVVIIGGTPCWPPSSTVLRWRFGPAHTDS